jgi:hypothetical protein
LKNIWRVKDEIVKWLTRVKVHESDITFITAKPVEVQKTPWKKATYSQAGVKYIYKGREYILSCKVDENYSENLNYINILIHSRVIGIERGIEDIEQAFAGYVAITHIKTPRGVLGCHDAATKEECKLAFKRLAKSYHPDAGGDSEMFSRINQAMREIEAEQ